MRFLFTINGIVWNRFNVQSNCQNMCTEAWTLSRTSKSCRSRVEMSIWACWVWLHGWIFHSFPNFNIDWTLGVQIFESLKKSWCCPQQFLIWPPTNFWNCFGPHKKLPLAIQNPKTSHFEPGPCIWHSWIAKLTAKIFGRFKALPSWGPIQNLMGAIS